MRIGIGLGIGFRHGGGGGGGIPTPTNVSPPSLVANEYAGGLYVVYPGSWANADSVALSLQSSADGVTWTDEGAIDGTGEWDAALAGLYVRPVETAQPGDVVAYGDAFGPLGPAYDYILDFNGNGNRLEHTVVSPFIGASLTAATTGASAPGIWMSVLWYYDGTGLENNAALVSLGNSASSLHNLDVRATSCLYRASSAVAADVVDVVTGAGWYLSTGWFYQSGGNKQVSAFVNEGSGTGASSGTGGIANLVTLRIGDTSNSTTSSSTNFDEHIAYVAFGRGNPEAAHVWAYNNREFRRIDEYNFASDAACSLDGFILTSRVGAATFDVSEIVDSVGSFDSWTMTGSLAWGARRPGFIYPFGDPPPLPNTFISPAVANPGDTFKLGAQSINIGATNPADFTVNSLTHSVLGNIAGTVSGGQFTCNTAGTITWNITHATKGNASGTVEIVPAMGLVANPQFADRYGGNARVAQIEEYPSPGAGTTYASAAALATAIDGLASGATLIVDDLSDLSNTLTLSTSNKDYGGATVVASNLHGVQLLGVDLKGARNLTIRGFRTVETFASTNSVGSTAKVAGITIDHCTGRYVYLKAITSTPSRLTLSNWIGPDDGTAGQMKMDGFAPLVIQRVAHGNLDTTYADVMRSDETDYILADRFYFGRANIVDPPGDNDPHPDCWQFYGNGVNGALRGLIQNGLLEDIQEAGNKGAQGLFIADGRRMGLMVRKVANSTPPSLNGIIVSGCLQNVIVEDCTSATKFAVTATYAAACVVSNCARSDPGNILTGNAAVETGTTQVTETLFPDLVSEVGSWLRFANPTTPGVGADAMIEELLAQLP